MRELVSNLVGLGFTIIDDLAESGKLVRDVDPEYDEEAGTVTPTDPVEYPISQIIETRFKATELNGSVDLKTDAKFIIYAPDLAVTPEDDDIIVYLNADGSDGTVWNVQNILGVPGRSVWIVHVRKK
ncbi:hypothetical protein [Candidatus Macondimonas diazotrophica]|jgi:hypothetical protein|uniref:Uncharacterized protein n=1 Tax=Candidatus Macondimonas diazotrophica TaxID=2305248 RepID=A0A4Z0F8J7_9GAMM|nr:hypothetical protein [Candidatus Macondimonas diazotrophica]TFZ81591.1 hypothetical protein E4680_11865 [Candidatus Macondimonas diazotrophica]